MTAGVTLDTHVAISQTEIQQVRDLLSSRMPPQQVARYCAPQNTHYFVWLRCGSKVQMFQLHNGSRLDVSGSSASVAATWNWIPTPSYVVLGDNYSTLPGQHDGFVELPAQLVASSGATEESPLMIEPRSAFYQLWCKLTAVGKPLPLAQKSR